GGRQQPNFGDWTISGIYNAYGKFAYITDMWGGRADLKPLTEISNVKVYQLNYRYGWGNDNAVDIAGGRDWFYTKVDSNISTSGCVVTEFYVPSCEFKTY